MKINCDSDTGVQTIEIPFKFLYNSELCQPMLARLVLDFGDDLGIEYIVGKVSIGLCYWEIDHSALVRLRHSIF